MVAKSRGANVKPTGWCFCGCGGRTAPDRHFIATHDRKAESAVIKEFYGSIADFVAHHRGGSGGANQLGSRR